MSKVGEKLKYAAEETEAYGPIKYGDVFPVAGDLADKVIVPKDAALMRAAEKKSLGDTIKGGAADVMQSAAKVNVQTGLVEPGDSHLGPGVRVVKSDIDNSRIVSEVIDNQVVSKYLRSQSVEVAATVTADGDSHNRNSDTRTIGDALEAAALLAGNKVVTQSDAAAIHVAEQLASGNKGRVPGGIADRAQAAANHNALGRSTNLADVIVDAKKKMLEDRPVTMKDAEVVVGAEMRTNARIHVTPGAVGKSLAAAAVFNSEYDQHGHQSPTS